MANCSGPPMMIYTTPDPPEEYNPAVEELTLALTIHQGRPRSVIPALPFEERQDAKQQEEDAGAWTMGAAYQAEVAEEGQEALWVEKNRAKQHASDEEPVRELRWYSNSARSSLARRMNNNSSKRQHLIDHEVVLPPPKTPQKLAVLRIAPSPQENNENNSRRKNVGINRLFPISKSKESNRRSPAPPSIPHSISTATTSNTSGRSKTPQEEEEQQQVVNSNGFRPRNSATLHPGCWARYDTATTTGSTCSTTVATNTSPSRRRHCRSKSRQEGAPPSSPQRFYC